MAACEVVGLLSKTSLVQVRAELKRSSFLRLLCAVLSPVRRKS